MTENWSEYVNDVAQHKAEVLARAHREESRKAAALVTQFAEDARSAGILPVRLKARSYDGNARYRTNVEGWYIKKDRSLAVGTDGLYYVLNTPTSFLARFRGTKITPKEPLLEIGRGARDGESMPLKDALANRLEAGNDWNSR